MTKADMSLEERMTPEERELYEGFKARIGKDFVPLYPHNMFFPNGMDEPVHWSRIKRWATVNEDFNALWFDEEYAKKSRWGGIIAPPLFLLAMDDGVTVPADFSGAIYDADCYVKKDKYPNFRGSMQANCEWEFFEPVRPGDKIDIKKRCSDVYWKQGTRYRLLFTKGEITYTNQKGQLVARSEIGAVYMFK
jgi:acyl dehydratase